MKIVIEGLEMRLPCVAVLEALQQMRAGGDLKIEDQRNPCVFMVFHLMHDCLLYGVIRTMNACSCDCCHDNNFTTDVGIEFEKVPCSRGNVLSFSIDRILGSRCERSSRTSRGRISPGIPIRERRAELDHLVRSPAVARWSLSKSLCTLARRARPQEAQAEPSCNCLSVNWTCMCDTCGRGEPRIFSDHFEGCTEQDGNRSSIVDFREHAEPVSVSPEYYSFVTLANRKTSHLREDLGCPEEAVRSGYVSSCPACAGRRVPFSSQVSAFARSSKSKFSKTSTVAPISWATQESTCIAVPSVTSPSAASHTATSKSTGVITSAARDGRLIEKCRTQCAGEKYEGRRIGHPYQSRAPPKRKPVRHSFTASQVAELEKLFEKSNYLSSAERQRVATQLNMTDCQLKTWYQNRRTKMKREIAETRERQQREYEKMAGSMSSSKA